ncbi:family 78 glycoside hydrolase catalytic domain [Microbacterium sp. MYb45]|uniref:family 78 glycoside hydrolase catalytic domain n=1 Tax=Microbacterium sp. MYb45 TaxID=1827294 RepID=UPI0011AFF9E3|nr:family 78 glycoside hydrolase catalytic domain [Microbacterium sp. MYb45]
MTGPPPALPVLTENELMPHTFSRLRVNGLDSPLGVDSTSVRLSWSADQPLRPDDLIVIELDSDSATDHLHVLSADARSIVLPRPAGRLVQWRVGVRREGRIAWDAPRGFTTAPDLESTGAQWVAHPAVARARAEGDDRTVWFAFDIESRASDTRTLLHLAAAGVVEVRVDGRLRRDGLLGPGYSDLRTEASAATHDLGLLAPGPHTVTIEMASGPYWISDDPARYRKFAAQHQAPRLLAAIEQFGASPRVATTTAGRTRTGRGATLAAHWYGGEDYDAGVPEPWEHGADTVAVAAGAPSPKIWWPEHPPLAVVETREASAAWEGSRGRVVDFGVNVAGVPEVRWQPAAEDRVVELHPAELISGDGVDQDSTGTPIFDSVRIPAGTAGSWSPRFGYHGFRYVELRGPSAGIDVSAHVIRAANMRAGGFTSGEPFLQRLHEVIDRAVQGNMHSVFTDCPHREKLGWLEQLHFCFDAIARGYDVEAHLRDMLHHARTAQLPSGAIPNTVPEFVDFSGHAYLDDDDAFRFDVNWGGVIVHLPLAHYREYGDRRVLEDNIAAMKAYVAYLASRQVAGLIDFGLGDWIAIDASASRELVASHGFLRVLESAEVIAEIVGEQAWSSELRALAGSVLHALRRHEAPGADASQTELVILTDIAEKRGDDAASDAFFASLLERIAADGDAFTVGEVTFALLVDLLHRRGHAELVHRTISRTDAPGYGMQLARGVTALAETWSAERLTVGEGSNNHFMLGMIDHWLQSDVAGLRQSPTSIAWRSAVIAPVFLAAVPSAASVYHSVRGTYRVAWHREGAGVRVEIEVPVDGQASVLIPGVAAHDVGPGTHVYFADDADTVMATAEVSAHG